MNLIDLYLPIVKQISSKANLDKGQKKSKIRALVTNTLAIINLIESYETKNKNCYHFIHHNKFHNINKQQKYITNAINFLKQNNIIQVYKKDGKEYFCHWINEDLGFNQLVSKGYKITEYGYQLINNSINNPQWNNFLEAIDIKVKNIKPYTPEEVMKKYSDEDYLFQHTKNNIINVLNNNLQLQFHPLSDQQMINIYRQEKHDNITDQDILFKLNVVKDYFANKQFTYNIRMYSAFTNTPKCWRRFVTNTNQQPIGELFDIHSSILNILPLICRIELLKRKTDKETYNSFLKEEKLLEQYLEQDVYELIGGKEYTREQIKSQLMCVIFSNNKSFNTIQCTPKGKIKKTASNKIKLWLKDNLPIMHQVIGTYDEVENKNKKQYWKKTKSLIWMQFQKIETQLMSELNRAVSHHFNTKCYCIHDGLFCNVQFINQTNKTNCRLVYKKIKDLLKKSIEQKYN